MKKIRFNQPKYIFGVIGYFGLLLVGGLIIWMFDTEIEDAENPNLQTTEYLNSELPDANVRDEIGNKRRNVQKAFGNISDYSSLQVDESDIDSVNKKEDFNSQYSAEELEIIASQALQSAPKQKSREMNERLQQSSQKGNAIGGMGNEYDLPITDADRARIQAMRRNGQMADIERDLQNIRGKSQDYSFTEDDKYSESINTDSRQPLMTKEKDDEPMDVVKNMTDTCQYFNTLASNEDVSHLINAIVDEEIKVIEGSRVRLRLLDDVTINGTNVRKGSYLYAIMSGFSQQRVQGTVKSIMIGEEIFKINLSIYDTDGLEGLYVPSSAFRETAKDVASSAMSSNMSMNNASDNNNVTQWAMQGLQNAYQRTSSAIAKAIKKNKVRIKYGTHVYLVNTKKNREIK